MVIPIVTGALGTISKGLVRIGNRKRSGDYSNYGPVEVSQNTDEIPGDLRRLAISQTWVKDYQQTLMWKTRKEQYNNNTRIKFYWILRYKGKLIPDRGSDLARKKRTCCIVNFAVPEDHRVKIEENKKRIKKAMEHEGDGDTNCNWCTWNDA